MRRPRVDDDVSLFKMKEHQSPTHVHTIPINVLVVGDPKVGKSRLCKFYANNGAGLRQGNGVEAFTKILKVGDTVWIQMKMFKVAGKELEKGRSKIILMMLRFCDVVLYMYNSNDLKSFKNVAKWSRHVKYAFGEELLSKSFCFLVGNNMNWGKEKVSGSMAAEFANENSWHFFETCSIGGKNAQRLFERIIEPFVKSEIGFDEFSKVVTEDLKARWNRCKLMIVGQGRAGKSATVRSILRQDFVEQWIPTLAASVTQSDMIINGNGENNIEVSLDNSKTDFTTQLAARVAAERIFEQIQAAETIETSDESARWESENLDTNPVNALEDRIGSNNEEEPKFSNANMGKNNEIPAERDVVKRYNSSLELKPTHGNHVEEPLGMSIWDYVDMRRLMDLSTIRDEMLYLGFWLNSIRMHAPDAPVFIVGTFLDQINVEDVEKVNELLKRQLSNMILHVNIYENRDVDLIFYPISNCEGSGVDTLLESIAKVAQDQDFVKQEVPLKWIRVLDLMIDMSPWINLNQVQILCQTVGIMAKSEVVEMLNLFHELGVLLYLTATESLRSMVILKPQWLIDFLCKVIRDSTVHSKYDAGEQDVGLSQDVDVLFGTGLASRDLLDYYWGEHIDFFLDLMRFSLLLSDWKFSRVEGMFLIPSLLLPCEEAETMNFKEEQSIKFIFNFKRSYLPTGVFERIVSLCVAYSGRFDDSKTPFLRRDIGKFWFGADQPCLLQLVKLFSATGDCKNESSKSIVGMVINDPNSAYSNFRKVQAMLEKVNNDAMNNGLDYFIELQSESTLEYFPMEMAETMKLKPWFDKSEVKTDLDGFVSSNMDINSFLDQF